MKDFDIFRNTDDVTVEMIAASYPVLSDEEKERMFAMSERKFNIKERKYPQGYTNEADEEYDDEDEVDGVEEYDRPMWLKFLTTAAALMLVGGGLAVGRNLLRRRPVPDNVPPPNIATAVSTGTQTTSVTGADNITYTIDVDAMLTGLETGQAVPAETTTTAAAPAAPAATQAPAVPAPTEAPTEAATETDSTPYQAIARELANNVTTLWEATGSTEERYFDYSDTFNVYYDRTGDGSDMDTLTYVRYVHPDFSSLNDFWDMAYRTYTKDYADWFYSGTFHRVDGIVPGSEVYSNDFPYFVEYDGKFYAWNSAAFSELDHYEISKQPIIIKALTEDSFQAYIPYETYMYDGSSISSIMGVVIVKENGVWVIDNNRSTSGEVAPMSFDDYVSFIAPYGELPVFP